MVSLRNLVAGLALLGAGAVAAPAAAPAALEARAFDPTCILNPSVVTAVTCILGCLGHLTDPSALGTCALECVRGLTDAEIVR
jgi:hypothetical protein